jgi:hypothetical protein
MVNVISVGPQKVNYRFRDGRGVSAKFRNVSCSGVNNFSHAKEFIALV